MFHHNAKTPAMPLTAFRGGDGGGETDYSVLHYFLMILHIARESVNECRKVGTDVLNLGPAITDIGVLSFCFFLFPPL